MRLNLVNSNSGTVAAAFGIMLLLPSPALGDCADCSILFGNLGAQTYLQLDLADPSASWLTYIYQDPTINQGQVPVGAVAFDLGDFGGEPGTALVFADWAAGLGLQGCPSCLCGQTCTAVMGSDPIQVAAFWDRAALTIIAVGVDSYNSFDFDRTKPEGGQLATSNLTPQVLNQWIGGPNYVDGPNIVFELGWEVSVNSDTAAASILASLLSYRVLYQAFDGSQLIEEMVVADLDGVVTDARATVAVPGRCNVTHQFTILADLKGKDGETAASLSGPATRFVYGVGIDEDEDRYCTWEGESCENRLTLTGWRWCSLDCDDDNPAVHPGAAEVCNAVDDDCDSSVDEDPQGVDSDFDTVPNACDNCAFAANPFQDDMDEDREGDACDLDDRVILFTDVAPAQVSWQREEGVAWFNLYRGDLAVLRTTGVYTQAGPESGGEEEQAAWRYCGLVDPSVADTHVPAAGQAVFYLATGVEGGVETTLGLDSKGVERPNTASCESSP